MTDKSTPYDDADLYELVKRLHAAFAAWSSNRGHMAVTADIEWAGDFNPRRHRSTVLFRGRALNLGTLRQLTATAHALLELVPKPYTVARPNIPVTFQGQLNWLTKTKAGQAHAETAGFKPSPQTLRRWKNGTQKPSARNKAALEAAGQRYHDQRVAEWEERGRARAAEISAAEKRLQAPARQVGDALDAELAEPIRLFNITELDFE